MIYYSLIICTYNRSFFLKATIESILTNFKEKSNYEVLIIDNNSTDGTDKMMLQFSAQPQLKYYKELQQGLSHARNRGIKEASNDILIFLDDDIEIDKKYLDILDEIFDNQSISIAGGKVLPHKATIPEWLPPKYYYLASVFDLGEEARFVDKLMGANYGMRKEVAKTIGWYDTRLGRKGNSLMGGEENDYFNRAQKFGFKRYYHPKLIVYHKVANKLTENYIFNYSFSNGRSQALIDKGNKELKVVLKIAKYIVMIVAYFLYGFYADMEVENRPRFQDFIADMKQVTANVKVLGIYKNGKVAPSKFK